MTPLVAVARVWISEGIRSAVQNVMLLCSPSFSGKMHAARRRQRVGRLWIPQQRPDGDQIVIFMALAAGRSEVRVGVPDGPNPHTKQTPPTKRPRVPSVSRAPFLALVPTDPKGTGWNIPCTFGPLGEEGGEVRICGWGQLFGQDDSRLMSRLYPPR